MKERVEPREGAPRCAYCHDDAAAAEGEPCDGCGALVHDECLALAQGCPTLGCPYAADPAEDPPDPEAGVKVGGAPGRTADGLSARDLLRRVRAADRALPWWVVLLMVVGLLVTLWDGWPREWVLRRW